MCERFGLDRDALARRIDDRARTARVLERLKAELKVVTRQRDALAMRCSSFSGRGWEEELADVGVDLNAPRDPNPSAVVPMDSLPSFRAQFEAEGRTRWSGADEAGEVTVHRAEDDD